MNGDNVTLPGNSSIAELFAGIELFKEVSNSALGRLASHAEFLQLPGGETLVQEGDPSDALFVMASGRLQVFVTSEGEESLVGEIGRGEVIGEMGVLAGERRSATVRALRDSNLIRIPGDDFVSFLHESPEELFALTRLLIRRLRRSIRAESPGASVRTIAIVPTGEGRDAGTFARYLTSAIAEGRRSRLVTGDDLSHVGDEEDLTRVLHDLEVDHDLLLYLADRQPSTWTDRCLRRAG